MLILYTIWYLIPGPSQGPCHIPASPTAELTPQAHQVAGAQLTLGAALKAEACAKGYVCACVCV